MSGLEEFRLTRRALRELGARSVTVEISIPVSPYVYPSAARFRELLKISPQQRRSLVRQWRVAKHQNLLRELPFRKYKIVRSNSAPIGVRLTVPAHSVQRLFRLRHAESIRIERISGRKRARTLSEERLYAVKAQLAFQLEGQTRGLQLCEERIFLLSARSERDARRRATREFRLEGFPSLTVSGHFHRCHFERILDVCEPIETSFNPAGTEVYYNYRWRRMVRAREWHPKRRAEQDGAADPRKDARG